MHNKTKTNTELPQTTGKSSPAYADVFFGSVNFLSFYELYSTLVFVFTLCCLGGGSYFRCLYFNYIACFKWKL